MANSVGRPRGSNNKDYNYTLRMDKYTKQHLENYCKEMNVSKSEALRRAIVLISESRDKESELI